ncbi:MAG TPA: hypothetical protein VFK80_02370 [Limnochordia bacterium]|nr:hypothetical protein [Limnochordia bacterium]
MSRDAAELAPDDLRVAVAENVFGTRWVPCYGGYGYWETKHGERSVTRAEPAKASLLAAWDSDTGKAFDVVEAMRKRGFEVFALHDDHGRWDAIFARLNDGQPKTISIYDGPPAKCAAEAICRAAVKAAGLNKEVTT